MFKVVFAGAGSIGFNRRVLGDILSVPELQNCRIAFTDANKHNM